MARALGRITPPDFEHVTAKPLAALKGQGPVDVPVVLGVNWYDSFDNPIEMVTDHSDDPLVPSGTSFHLPDVAKGESLGNIRGGHCFCLAPLGEMKQTVAALQKFYDQGVEGACVGFGNARAQSIMRGHQEFDAFWLYDECRRQEGTYPEGEGSTVRAAATVLETEGLRVQTGNEVCTREVGDGPVDPKLGVASVRWTTTVDEVLAALARDNGFAVPFQNSWGDAYPDEVWMPVATLERLLSEEGEACCYADR